MRRLGYSRYVAQGGDQGAAVTDAMGRQAPEGLVGIHLNLLVPALGNVGPMPADTERGTRGARHAITTFRTERLSATSSSSPRGRRRSATPCWILPSPWRPGCSTTTPTATTRSRAPLSTASPRAASPETTSSTTSRSTGSRAPGPRRPGRTGRADKPAARAAGQAPPPISLPVGFTTFPGEIFQAPRSWVEQAYPHVTYFNEVDKGGHFAAWEEPELFATELRAAFRSLHTA